MKTLWGLADGNNFYASCERLFRPDLATRPVAILSNNDGCVIARSNELKALGIKMGAAEFEIRDKIRDSTIVPFSSNYENYGEMHNRMMHTLSRFTPDTEIYSVDECWLQFNNFNYDMHAYGRHISAELWRLVGIPVNIGIAPTKTLAKVANKLSKRDRGCEGTRVIIHPHEITIALGEFPVEDLWGVGIKKAAVLHQMGVKTALHFRELPGDWVKKRFTITGFRMWRELHGYPCLELEHEGFSKENIATGRTFGKLLTEKDQVAEALANHAAACALKLRRQKSLAGYINVQLETHRFRTDLPQYNNNFTAKLLQPTNNTAVIVKHALQCLEKIWKAGIHYNRCGVLMMNLKNEAGGQQASLFESYDQKKSTILMETMDKLNNRFGRDKLLLATQATAPFMEKAWKLKANFLSPNYLTRVKDFITLNM